MKSWPRIDDRLGTYVDAHWRRESDVLRRLREETQARPMAGMQISPHQGQTLGLLARLIGARRAVEVGTFTGYSSICLAEALGLEGKLWCCDVSDEWTSVARRYWREAQLDDRIELTLAPATETLDRLLANGLTGTLDLAFIDADKSNYDAYYERCLKLLRPGGLILVDNVLWGGSVADPTKTSEDTEAIRALNAKLHADSRVDLALFSVGDGMTAARKR
ncbi:MAG: SAM-dependent methyltransferase [Alphaproteobacteria bacterium]|nr:SAM-dependent methyltransferase [Alphaproteobacteria bacterium]MBM3643943.1 SAM-dependent methyltransferase [Alphaproteobacteria bacterium]